MVDTKQARWVYRVARNFCGLGIFSVSRKLIFATRCYEAKSVAWLWDGVILLLLNFVIKLIASPVCQIMLIAGLNIQSIQLTWQQNRAKENLLTDRIKN